MSIATGPLVAGALVAGIRRLGDYSVLALLTPEIAATARPGQFVNIRLDEESAHVLRRPFSIYRTHPAEGLVEVAFDVVGPGTEWIASRRACTTLDVAGPLGNGFGDPDGDGPVVMVGGGYGASALFQLGADLRAAGRRTVLVAGGATARRVFGATETGACFDEVVVTTEDGSAGTRGLVTDALGAMMNAERVARVYACGPMPMLAAVSRMSAADGVSCEVAAEEFMACGTGVCWTCVVPVLTGTGRAMHRCCTEGPVFDGARVEWR